MFGKNEINNHHNIYNLFNECPLYQAVMFCNDQIYINLRTAPHVTHQYISFVVRRRYIRQCPEKKIFRKFDIFVDNNINSARKYNIYSFYLYTKDVHITTTLIRDSNRYMS